MCSLLMLLALLPSAAPLPTEATAEGLEKTRAPLLIWKDATTGRVIFTSNDIISFDWDKQAVLLERNAMLDFLAWIPPHMHQARKLVVSDQMGTIYEAHWVSSLSSMGFSGPVYERLEMPSDPYAMWSPYLCIRGGYPGRIGTASNVADVRFAERLRHALEEAGVLGSIDLTRDPVGLRIQSSGHSWTDCGEDLKIRVEFFDDTFRVPDKARAHIFFAGGEKTVRTIDSIAIEIRFVANWGTYRSDCRIDGVPPSVIRDGIYVCRFSPWQPLEGSTEPLEAGMGAVCMTILLQRTEGAGTTTVHRLDFGEVAVPVIAP